MYRLRPCYLYTPPVVATDGQRIENRRGSDPFFLPLFSSEHWEKDLEFFCEAKTIQCSSTRGSKSRNKVSVGEPAEGSLSEIVYSDQIQIQIQICGGCGREKKYKETLPWYQKLTGNSLIHRLRFEMLRERLSPDWANNRKQNGGA